MFLALLAVALLVPVVRKVELELGPRRLEAYSFELVEEDRINPAWEPGLHVMRDQYMQHPQSTKAVYLRVGDWVYFTFWSQTPPAQEASRPRH